MPLIVTGVSVSVYQCVRCSLRNTRLAGRWQDAVEIGQGLKLTTGVFSSVLSSHISVDLSS